MYNKKKSKTYGSVSKSPLSKKKTTSSKIGRSGSKTSKIKKAPKSSGLSGKRKIPRKGY